MQKKWLYLPIEVKVRELYGKIFLACVAAENGFNAVVGSKKDVRSRIKHLPKGIVLNFGLSENFARMYKEYQNIGQRVAIIEEEGLVTLKDELYLRHRVSKKTFNEVDWAFCWGERQASLIKNKIVDTNHKIFVTGNPRFDILRSEYRSIFHDSVREIKKKYGNFILINTNFGSANHYSGEKFAKDSLKKKGYLNNSENGRYFRRRMIWQKRVFGEFMKMIPQVSKKFCKHKLIIRPHPSENIDTWRKLEKDNKNVFVVHQGNVVPWIMSADVLIHNGCTTSVEAFLLKNKAVAYRPFVEDDLESDLPNKISIQTFNLNELVGVLNKILLKNFEYKTSFRQKDLDFYVAGMSGKTASEEIISILNSTALTEKKKFFASKFLFFEIAHLSKKAVKKILSKSLTQNNYLAHKVPGLTTDEIRNIIKKFTKINGRFSDIKVKRIGETCHRLYKR